MIMADWYADHTFAVHADMKSHTGGVFTRGKGATKSVWVTANDVL